MSKQIYSVITGSGSYIPENIIKNEDFLNYEFYDSKGELLDIPNNILLSKFHEITAISERRYASNDMVTSDLAYFAAENAIRDSGINKEELDYVIVAHNFGDVKYDNRKSDMVPTLASRVKYKLGIASPKTIAYDLPFGCPGWLQAVIQANYYIKSGDAKKILVIGSEMLSRVSDPHDRDSLLYSDGAGAVVLEAVESEEPIGILAHGTRSDTINHGKLLVMDKSYNPKLAEKGEIFLKMNGRKLYQYALETVPLAIKECLEKSKVQLSKIKKVLIHQANGKMDEAILQRLYGLCNNTEIPENVMPMTIDKLGNSSVATLPTLFDLIKKGLLKSHKINKGDLIVFASVGAGMNVNAIVYQS
ncbi:MAG: 3-oxoacyl-ACP synthase [Ignavibacteria bacterium GWF2_33_9]|nr:MAG: 3-oxoacyl-ACP synthase [Ignavibacteria bacterium GWF2_33_9]